MRQLLFSFIMLFTLSTGIQAQSPKNGNKENRRFSHEEFQAKQKEYIAKYADLTTEETEKFFPIFFELQKEKWNINRDARKKVGMKRGQQCTDEQCQQLINEFADAKIKIAELEKEYIQKYLKVIPAKKIMAVQRAEDMFQRYMLKRMSRERDNKSNKNR